MNHLANKKLGNKIKNVLPFVGKTRRDEMKSAQVFLEEHIQSAIFQATQKFQQEQAAASSTTATDATVHLSSSPQDVFTSIQQRLQKMRSNSARLKFYLDELDQVLPNREDR